ncbi:putative GCN5-related N-acetyltransferase [Actinoplanes missouriensis 431]|uniref:Putative GCN5-related N-acetyltransferase n=1 Tax=Actinoplanes missouriensis (strain ATCC 14538 / DSM 43046 / CBS 188.64 / JCM 3121 / NBRC 102363 / NCIMB 12654 / NRRL B-3342 / UNCC 431) TaxID=512565 RepID=I0H9W8_ACTM4|nr:GNAT family N-acetyltransferase [Actinoplanes missouriensis]BAL89805.1 putative GCN5-related N-acetyltransferase [Actinoplanes missouriensis 431]
MTKVVTYVEMTSLDDLRPAAPVPGLALEPLDPASPLVIELQVRIGAPYGWKSASRTPEEWAAHLAAHPDRRYFAVTFEGEPAGMVACHQRPGDDVEIETFGLVPEFTGRRLGGYALTLGIRQAWSLTPGVKRVWLHTSTQDHPNALPNYHRRGFRTFATESR